MLELSIEVGGTITGEHGVGVEKINQMCVQFPDSRAADVPRGQARVRRARLLNPGKAVPTLAPLRRIRTHARARRQSLLHPELPRFLGRDNRGERSEGARRSGWCEAAARRQPLRIRGGGTQGVSTAAQLRGEVLDTRGYSGIVDYEPTELVVTARVRHAACENSSARWRNAARCLPSSRRTSVPAHARRWVAAGLSGPRRATSGRGARFRARRAHDRRARAAI